MGQGDGAILSKPRAIIMSAVTLLMSAGTIALLSGDMRTHDHIELAMAASVGFVLGLVAAFLLVRFVRRRGLEGFPQVSLILIAGTGLALRREPVLELGVLVAIATFLPLFLLLAAFTRLPLSR